MKEKTIGSDLMDVNETDEDEFGFSRNYFLAKDLRACGKKSTKKLSDLALFDEQELREEASKIEQKHGKETASLLNNYKSLYPEWVFELRCGFGLLFYGFGSKKALIEDFASTTLSDSDVVVINGYLQSINLKHVATTLAEVLWDQMKVKSKMSLGSMVKNQPSFSSQSFEDILTFLDDGSHSEDSHCYVCLVVHNFGGPGLRELESQQTLARIASCSLVRIVASVDHVNAPLIWDKKMVHRQFNWSWYHVPTFEPYKIEGLFFPLVLATGGTVQSANTAVIALESLTSNAQSVFKVLAKHQLAHPDEEGTSINELYLNCSKELIVSSRDRLGPYLTEFQDHALLKTRRRADGQDCYYIPFTPEALENCMNSFCNGSRSFNDLS